MCKVMKGGPASFFEKGTILLFKGSEYIFQPARDGLVVRGPRYTWFDSLVQSQKTLKVGIHSFST